MRVFHLFSKYLYSFQTELLPLNPQSLFKSGVHNLRKMKSFTSKLVVIIASAFILCFKEQHRKFVNTDILDTEETNPAGSTGENTIPHSRSSLTN